MNKPKGSTIAWSIVAVVAILVTLFFGVNYPIPPAPADINASEATIARAAPSIIDRLYVRSGADIHSGNLTVTAGNVGVTAGNIVATAGNITATAGDLTAGDDLVVAGDAAITGNLTAGTWTAPGLVTDTASLALTATNAAGGSAVVLTIDPTLGIMNGSDNFTAVKIYPTNANHTSTGNTVQGVDIGAITGDADATETAVLVGTGWDAGLDLNGTPLVIGADGGVTLDETTDDVVALQMGAGTGTFSILTGNLKVGAGTPGTSQNGQDAYFSDGVEVDGTAKLDGTVNATGAVNVTGLTTATGGATLGGWTILTVQTPVVVSAGSIITPTGTYQVLTSASSVTCSTTTCIADGTTSGQLLVLRNANASDTITIDGTGGNVECKSDIVLGAQDTITLVWNSADWVCLATHDNS